MIKKKLPKQKVTEQHMMKAKLFLREYWMGKINDLAEESLKHGTRVTMVPPNQKDYLRVAQMIADTDVSSKLFMAN